MLLQLSDSSNCAGTPHRNPQIQQASRVNFCHVNDYIDCPSMSGIKAEREFVNVISFFGEGSYWT